MDGIDEFSGASESWSLCGDFRYDCLCIYNRTEASSGAGDGNGNMSFRGVFLSEKAFGF